MSDKRKRLTEREEQELLFQKRLAELRARNNQFPWNMKEQP
jgi:hypothetical protein